MKVKVKQILVLVVNLSVSIIIKASSSTGSNMNIYSSMFLIVEPNIQEGQQADTLTYTLYVINFKSAF